MLQTVESNKFYIQQERIEESMGNVPLIYRTRYRIRINIEIRAIKNVIKKKNMKGTEESYERYQIKSTLDGDSSNCTLHNGHLGSYRVLFDQRFEIIAPVIQTYPQFNMSSKLPISFLIETTFDNFDSFVCNRITMFRRLNFTANLIRLEKSCLREIFVESINMSNY